MRYKVKEKNLTKLKKYIDADSKTESEREAKRFYDTVRGTNKQRIQKESSNSNML